MTSDRRGFRVNLWIFFAVNGAIALAWVGCTVVGVSLHGFVWPWLAMVLLWGARLAYEARHAKRGSRHGPQWTEEEVQREAERIALRERNASSRG
jgi:2TM domain